MFASQSQLDFQNTFPRDDIISLAFLMIFLLRGGSLPNIDIKNSKNLETDEYFLHLSSIKMKYEIYDLCPEDSETVNLTNFV